MLLKQCIELKSFVLLLILLLIFLPSQNIFPADPEPSQLRAKLGQGIAFRTVDKNFSAKTGGLLQIDSIPVNSNNTLIHDNNGIRRGRMTLDMQFYRNWDLRATYDFTADQLDARGFQILYLGYKGIRRTHFKMGNLQEFVGLDWLTSSRYSKFMERAQMIALIPPLHLGITAQTYGDSWTLSTGLFSSRPIDGIHLDNGWGISSRFTFTPINNKKTILHLGISGAYREPGNERKNLHGSVVGSFNDFNAEGIRFSSLGRLNNASGIIGTEFAARHESLALQFEYLRTFDHHHSALDTEFKSWYIQGSWLLTGEKHRYRKKQGVWGAVRPKRKTSFKQGIGAWEVALRYSELNAVNKTNLPIEAESNLTIGLNWYLQRYMRLMANYIHVRPTLGAENLSAKQEENANIFALRLQIQF